MVPRPALLEPKAGLQCFIWVITSFQIQNVPSRMLPWCCSFWVSRLLQVFMEGLVWSCFWVRCSGSTDIGTPSCLRETTVLCGSLSLIPSGFPGPQIKFPHRCASVKCKPTPSLQRAAWPCRVLVSSCFLARIQFA